MRTLNFKHAIEALGYKIEKYLKGYNFRSAFASKDGQLYYFHIEDLRDDNPVTYMRTAKSISDFKGGVNNFSRFQDECSKEGILVIEKRQKCDYNSL